MSEFHYFVDPPLEISGVNIPTTIFDTSFSGIWFTADSGAVRFDEPVDFEPEGHC